MSKKHFLFLSFILFATVALKAQTKWYQQKRSILPTAVGIDGLTSFPRNESGGMIIDFDNDGLKDFIIPTYFSPQGNYDVQFVRFLKNIGNGQFKDVTDQYVNPDNNKFSKFLVGMNDRRGVVLDYNKDGKMDFIFPAAWENQDYSTYETIFGFTKMKDYYYKSSPSNYIEYRAGGGFQSPSFFYQSNGSFKKGYDLFDTKTFTVDSDVETDDLNNDGWPDIVISQSGYKMNSDYSVADWLGGITIWMNDAGRGFKFNHMKLVDSINKYSFGFQDEGKVGIADMNGDGFKDLIIYGIKYPYKPRTDITSAQQDSVLWDANYITRDLTRPVSYETRIYFSNRGVFDGANFIVVDGLRATFPMGVDLNNDGKTDILAVWKNYRAGGPSGVYTDTITNKNGINNQYYAFINKGNNQFEDQTANYFPNDNYKFSRLGRGDFYYMDIDGDGKNDFIPLSMGDDTLGVQYGPFGVDPATSNATVYYKNINNNGFKKITIDTLTSNTNNQVSEYYLNRLYIDDLNKDCINDLIGFSHWNIAPIVRCETPILNSYIQAVCGTDTLTSRTIKVKNFYINDSIFWNYNGNITKTITDSFKVKEFGWVVAVKKDATGCVSFSSDTLFIRRSPKPTAPRVYSINNTMNDPNNICKGEVVNLAADPQSVSVTGTILWFDKSKQLIANSWGGVKTLFESAGPRNITTTSKIQIDSARNVYTLFLSDDGCYSDTSNFFQINFKVIKPPVLSKDANNNLYASASGNIIWYKYGVLLPDTTTTIKLVTSGTYAATSTVNGCSSALSTPYAYLSSDLINKSNTKIILKQQVNLLGGVDTATQIDGQHSFPRSYQGLAIIDFDGDGLKDFIRPSYYSPQGNYDVSYLRFYKNTGKGNFQEVTNQYLNSRTRGKYYVGMHDDEPTIIDFNKDGKEDFFYSDGWENQVYTNYDSIFGFEPYKDYYAKKVNPTPAEAVLSVAGLKSYSFFYFKDGKLTNGQDLFDKRIYGTTSAIAKYDYNDDGWDDLVAFSDPYHGTYLMQDSNFVKPINGLLVWLNDGGKGFKLYQNIPAVDTIRKVAFQLENSSTINIADFNGDGYKDVILYGSSVPFKVKNNKYDSAGWPIGGYGLNLDQANTKYETRVYLGTSNKLFDPVNYIVIPNMRAKVSHSIDLNNDGKLDIITEWNNSNYMNGKYLDSITNLNGVNTEYKVYINKGNFVFDDQTNNYFPYDTTRFSTMINNMVKLVDIDGDGFKDIFPQSFTNENYFNGTTPVKDTTGLISTVYYKNYANQFFKKTVLDTFYIDKAWKNFPFLSNIDSLWAKFIVPTYGANSLPIKGKYLIDTYSYLNQVIPSDLNNDGKLDFIASAHLDNSFIQKINTNLANNYNTWTSNPGYSMIMQCNPIKPVFSNTKFSFCSGDSIKLSISNIYKGDTIKWFYGTKSDLTNASNKTFTDSTKLFVTRTDSIGCVISSDTITLVKNVNPLSPQVLDTTFCQNTNSSKLTAINSNGASLAWYSTNSIGGIASANSPNAITTDTITKYYFVSQINSITGCESPRAKITVKINPTPKIPIVRDTFYCYNINADTLRFKPNDGNSLLWYGNNATGGTPSNLGFKPTTSVVGNFSYYVSQINNITGCEGDRAKVNVLINPLPSAPIVKDTSYCNNGSSDTIRVSPTSGNTLVWYGTNATGGTATNTAIKPSTTTVGIASYYLSQITTATGCEGPRAKINITTFATPSAPILSRDTANNLVASINGITWYKDGTAITDTVQKIKPTIGGSYTAKTTQNGCTSALSTPYYYLVTDIINLSADEFIKLSPNPFSNQLNFDFVVKGYQRLNMDIFDIATGTKVASKQNLTPGIPIYLGQLASGTYVIKVTSSDLKLSYQFKMVKL